jgi:catechol 2,3-dioxygenase-like lactoylglutathione lyase family enzyme
MFELDGIDHVALAVPDVARSANWYIEVLGFERRYEGMWNGVPVFIGKGRTALALFPAREEALSSTNRGERVGMLHLAFGATRAEFTAAQRELRTRGISFGFQDHEISHSIYFEDPDGIRLEITTYEMADGDSPVARD